MNIESEKLLTKVREHYETSRDFNGLPIHALEKTYSNLNGTIIELIRSEEIELVRGDIHPIPHIKALPAEPICEQVRKIEEEGLGTGCLYPTPKHLKSFGTRRSEDAPFTLELELGAPQLDFRVFDLRLLEWYRNDPRYSFYSNDIHGRIRYQQDTQATDNQIIQDKLDNFEFGFAYNEMLERAVAVCLRDLRKYPPEQQRYLASFQRSGAYDLHPDFFRTKIIGDFPVGISIYDAFLQEKKIINVLCKKIGYQPLFRTNTRLAGFGILIRPTKKEFQDFALLLDQLLSDDLNRDFFKNDIPVSEKLTRENGSTVKSSIGTITLLENWIKKNFRPKHPSMIDALFNDIRAVRKARQRPAHKADENQFNPTYMEEQKELITKAYHAVSAIRMILENHPIVQGSDYQASLGNTKVWTR